MMKVQSLVVSRWSLAPRSSTMQSANFRSDGGMSRQRLTTSDQRRFFMRIAYLDCFSGISGDMFLGALVDAGVSTRLFEYTVAALDIGARLEISCVLRAAISATKVDVYSDGETDLPREVFWKQHDHAHAH